MWQETMEFWGRSGYTKVIRIVSDKENGPDTNLV